MTILTNPSRAGSSTSSTARLRPRMAVLGDSITASALPFLQWGPQFWAVAAGRSFGRIQIVKDAGIGGDTSTGMLARFDTDVAPYAPDVVHVLAMTNDVGQGFTMATSIANMTAIVNKILALGATPVLGTIPPRTVVSAMQGATSQRNHWLRKFAAANGYPLIDYHAVLVDGTTGEYKSGWTADGVHPLASGKEAMATAMLAALSPLLLPSTAFVAQFAGDPNNLCTNGFGAFAAEPTVPTISISKAATGSALAAATYFYKVAYISYWGETLPSNEVSIAAAAGDSITLTLPVLTSWQKLAIYRSTASGAEVKLDEVVAVGATANTYVDAGTKTPTAATPQTAGNFGQPTGWNPGVGPGIMSLRKVIDPDFKGNAFECAFRATSGLADIRGPITLPNVGDVIAFSFKIKCLTGDINRVTVNFTNSASNGIGLYGMDSVVLGGANGLMQYYGVYTVPAGTTGVGLQFVYGPGSLYRIGEISAVNLTTLGLV